MAPAVKPPRTYDSSRRQEQARQTRLTVLRSAHDLFVKHGYGRTTMADIAEAAGVSVETVYAAFKNKPTLLRRVWDITIGGDDEDVVFHERPEVRAIREEQDLATRFMLHAAMSTKTARRMTPFLLALEGAAGTEPAAAEMLDEIGRQRLAGMTVMARGAAATGQLAVSEEECRDVVWATTDGLLWHRLVNTRGWTDERFATWLGQLWVRMLVDPAAQRANTSRAKRRRP
jgi:AcrR family transcriptional regulator